jgi:hypothetical protein
LVPPDIPAHRIVNPFPGRLSESIRVYNKMSCSAAQIQVRAAAHLGTVYRDKHDLVSDDINLLFRMLNARPLKTDLERTGAGLALASSACMYDSLIRPRPSLIGPGPMRHVRATVKGTRIDAWIYVPGAPQPLQRRRRVPSSAVSWARCRPNGRNLGKHPRLGLLMIRSWPEMAKCSPKLATIMIGARNVSMQNRRIIGHNGPGSRSRPAVGAVTQPVTIPPRQPALFPPAVRHPHPGWQGRPLGGVAPWPARRNASEEPEGSILTPGRS